MDDSDSSSFSFAQSPSTSGCDTDVTRNEISMDEADGGDGRVKVSVNYKKFFELPEIRPTTQVKMFSQV